ncbi:MAG: zinc-ribbon domain-containing protein [Clostridiales bacterium]|nr:zinc-ribbon domain-containing protein [Clostridiales bacterium]
MKCSVCGTELPNDAKFCSKCGSNVAEQPNEANNNIVYCSNCGKPVDPSLPYCLNCGFKVEGNNAIPEKVGFVEAYRLYWKNYFKFTGRSGVSEYWFVVLWDFIIGIAISLIQRFSGFTTWYSDLVEHYFSGGDIPTIAPFAIVVAVIVYMWELANLIPGLALTVRRLHDTGKSGWYILMWLIPFVGWIFVLVALIKQSQPCRNQYND